MQYQKARSAKNLALVEISLHMYLCNFLPELRNLLPHITLSLQQLNKQILLTIQRCTKLWLDFIMTDLCSYKVVLITLTILSCLSQLMQ